MSTPLDTPTTAARGSPRSTPVPTATSPSSASPRCSSSSAPTPSRRPPRCSVGFGDPVGPRLFPYVIGAVTVLLGVLLVIATLRGDVPQAEGGEDIDLRHPADWTTVLKLVGVLLFTVLTISFLGWAVSGALLFVGSAWSLGSRTLVRDVIVGFVLSVASWYFFHEGLGVILPAGILDGVL